VSEIQLSIIDTFTDKIFHGQPVAVCLIQEDLNDELLHAIALENNYPETVFLQFRDSIWHLRSFNSQGEIYSNGSGILAGAYVYLQNHRQKVSSMDFKTVLGTSKVMFRSSKIYIESPYIHVQVGKVPESYWQHFSIAPQDILQNGPDVIVYFNHQDELQQVQVNIAAFKNLISGSLILTAKGAEADIRCRCFSPRVSLVEETATPAIYPRLFHWWSEKLKHKNQLSFEQGLTRRSEIDAFVLGSKLMVGGYCRSYFQGDLLL
jgi:PhzF family phenazine biosynthesis protein